MRLSPAFALGTALMAFVPGGIIHAQSQPALAAGSANFTIYQGDKSVGTADRSLAATGNGYSITSQGKVNLSKFSYSFSGVQHLDHSLNLVSDQLNGSVNGKPVTFTAHADPTGRQFQISINAEGKETQNTADRHQHLVLLSDLDPAAYTLLVQVGLESPRTSWILIPKEQGFIVPSTYSKGANVRGQLNGSQVDVQHMTVTVGEQNPISVELYYGHDNDLLEADLPEQNFFVVRNGFKLIDRPKPAAPPRGQTPPPQQNGQPSQANPAPQSSTTPQAKSVPHYTAPQTGTPQVQPQ